MTLSEPEFSRSLADFISKIDQFSKIERWTLHKSTLGICAKQSVMVKWRNETVNRQVHITYSSTYNVPVLWFNIYRRDGTPLTTSEALELSSNQNTSDLVQHITQNEHPLLGVLFYNIHPCKTMNIMAEIGGQGNYIAKWLSVYGAPIGLSLPITLFSEKRFSASETSQSSENGSITSLI